jgi:hypothetical protein
MPTHPCLSCQSPTNSDDTRCPSCQRAQRTAALSPTWQRRSREAIARAPWCALCSSNEELTTDYTAHSGIRVLCAACSSGRQRLPR